MINVLEHLDPDEATDVVQILSKHRQKVIVPKSNLQDIIIDKDKIGKIEVIPVETISDVLKVALDWTDKKDKLGKILKE